MPILQKKRTLVVKSKEHNFMQLLFKRTALMDSKRISELDALRGVAAFIVLIGHCFAIYPPVYDIFNSRSTSNPSYLLKSFTFSPLHIFWNGHAAVILFFILSGFVLSVSHYHGPKFYYPGYLIKRLCRLYIPYIIIVTISVLLINFYQGKHGIENVSYPYDESWSSKINITDYLKLLILTGKIDVVDLPLWTIIIEIKISIILPVFIMLIKKLSFIKNLLLILVCIVIVKLSMHVSVISYIPDFKILYFLPFFLAGSVLYRFRVEIMSLKINNMATQLILYCLILTLCNWEWIIVWIIKYDKNSIYYMINDYIVAFGCILLMIVTISNVGAIKKILNTKALQFLGQISYSLYLVHVIVIMFILYSFRSAENIFLVPLIIVATLLFSYAYYLYIEQPSIKLGKYLAANFTQKLKTIE